MGGVGQDGQARCGARPEIAVGPAALQAEHLRDVLEPDAIGIAMMTTRRADDPAWPGPVWGHSPAETYTADELTYAAEVARRALGL